MKERCFHEGYNKFMCVVVVVFQLLAEIRYSLHMGIHCPCNHCDTGECACVSVCVLRGVG